MLAALMWFGGVRGPLVRIVAPAISIVLITLTTIVLIVDLKRPERFYYILTRSNWRSWLVWGTWFLVAHGAISGAWLVAGIMSWHSMIGLLVGPAFIAAVLATSYTGFLFAQGLGRDLWQGPHAAIDLIAQSATAGAATLMLAAKLLGMERVEQADDIGILAFLFFIGLVAHLTILIFENVLSPSPTRHHELAVETIRRGACAPLFWGGVICGGGAVPLVLFFVGMPLKLDLAAPPALIAAAALALAGGAVWDYIWVEAGQSVPLS
jgi:formate-dependent nitrite reductase membrane component NrfD